MTVLSSTDVLANCTGASNATDQAIIKCVTEQLLVQDAYDREFSRTILLVYSAALVFLMQAGEYS